MCGFHGDYLVMGNKTLLPLQKKQSNCCKPATAEQNRLFIARRWQRPGKGPAEKKRSQCCSKDDPEIETLDSFLHRVRSQSFTITAMAFQDAGNIDLERLRRCSLHVFDDGRTVPFCAYYLTAQ
jgi:hypothetical protein